jgi:hypothetical protein
MLPLLQRPHQVRQQPRDILGRDYANIEKLSQHIGMVMLAAALINASQS